MEVVGVVDCAPTWSCGLNDGGVDQTGQCCADERWPQQQWWWWRGESCAPFQPSK